MIITDKAPFKNIEETFLIWSAYSYIEHSYGVITHFPDYCQFNAPLFAKISRSFA